MGLGFWGDLVGGYGQRSTCKLVSPKVTRAEAFILVTFPSCICPCRDIQCYYLIELRGCWEILCCISEWFSCFTAAIRVSGWVRPPLYLHRGLAVLSPSAALGSSRRRCSIDYCGQTGLFVRNKGVERRKGKMKSPLVACCRPGRSCAKAGWFMNCSAPIPGGFRNFCVRMLPLRAVYRFKYPPHCSFRA